MTIGLGIDTSFDDTAVAVVENENVIRANLCVSQFAEHAEFGGIVPERASRLHVEMIFPLLDEALERAGITLDDIDYVAVTNRPGLVGSLLVGVTVAKGIALARDLPLIGIDHLEAHVHAGRMVFEDLDYPFISLLISGANTIIYWTRGPFDHQVLGATLDDAVGECIDKTGRMLGLSMPAGPALQDLALQGDPSAVALPRPMLASNDFDFSFSGLKTAVLRRLETQPQTRREDLAAAILASIADVLVKKTLGAAAAQDASRVLLCGGAAANLQIREAFAKGAAKIGARLHYPPIALCTDNAAMVAGLGAVAFAAGHRADLSLDVRATVPLERL